MHLSARVAARTALALCLAATQARVLTLPAGNDVLDLKGVAPDAEQYVLPEQTPSIASEAEQLVLLDQTPNIAENAVYKLDTALEPYAEEDNDSVQVKERKKKSHTVDHRPHHSPAHPPSYVLPPSLGHSDTAHKLPTPSYAAHDTPKIHYHLHTAAPPPTYPALPVYTLPAPSPSHHGHPPVCIEVHPKHDVNAPFIVCQSPHEASPHYAAPTPHLLSSGSVATHPDYYRDAEERQQGKPPNPSPTIKPMGPHNVIKGTAPQKGQGQVSIPQHGKGSLKPSPVKPKAAQADCQGEAEPSSHRSGSDAMKDNVEMEDAAARSYKPHVYPPPPAPYPSIYGHLSPPPSYGSPPPDYALSPPAEYAYSPPVAISPPLALSCQLHPHQPLSPLLQHYLHPEYTAYPPYAPPPYGPSYRAKEEEPKKPEHPKKEEMKAKPKLQDENRPGQTKCDHAANEHKMRAWKNSDFELDQIELTEQLVPVSSVKPEAPDCTTAASINLQPPQNPP